MKIKHVTLSLCTSAPDARPSLNEAASQGIYHAPASKFFRTW